MFTPNRILLAIYCLVATSALAQSAGTLAATATVTGSTRLHVAALTATATGVDTAVLHPSIADLRPAASATPHQRVSMLLVTAENANLASETYTLAARLDRHRPAGQVWKINGVALSERATVLTTAGTFNTPEPYQWVVEAPEGMAIDSGLVISITPNK